MELISHLYAKKVLNPRQHRILTSMRNDVEKNEMLIEIWEKTSRINFLKIIECLNISGQSHVGKILKDGGGIFELHVTMDSEERHVATSEDQIVQTIRSILKGRTLEEQTRIMELVKLGSEDVQLISARKSGSVALYYHCTTLVGLEHLHQLMSSGRLKTIVEAAFNEILISCAEATMADEGDYENQKSTNYPDVFMARWSDDEYNNCKAFLQESSGSSDIKNSSSKPIVVREQVYEMTKCCICTQTFNNPRSLPCLHTFCRKCLERCAENKSPGERIGCPICRQQWKIPVDGIDGFPRNNWVEKLVELGNNSGGKESKEILCDVCCDNVEGSDAMIPVAMKHCIECQQNMCKECAFHHSRQKLSRGHELINLVGLDEIERTKLISSTCDKHPRKPMVIYCLNCQMTVCQICFDESHGGHKSDEVRKIAKGMQTDLDSVADSMASIVKEMKDVMGEDQKKMFLNRVSATEIEIRDRCEKVIMIVEHHKQRLIEYLGIVKSRIQKEYGMATDDLEIHLGEIRSVIKLIQDLKAQGSISDITGVGPSLLTRAQELQKNQQVMFRKMKSQINWPNTELVPVDIDELLSYNSGNIVGKIRVNTCITDGDCEYYKFCGTDDYMCVDDSYIDCVFQPKIDSPSQELDKSKVTFDSGSDDDIYSYTDASVEKADKGYDKGSDKGSVGSEENSKEYDGYTQLHSDDSDVQQGPPVPMRVKSSPGLLQSNTGDHRGNEIPPSEINLERRLSRGKFTEIWHGKYNQVDDVAVKTFTSEAKKESWIVKSCNFFQEAEILRGLQHDNIVRLIGVHSIGQPFYVITETTSKGYLDHYLKQDKGVTLTLKIIINMATQIASAMRYLEINHCIHRYLAAKSILVGENNSIKLTNFEMARILGKIREHTTTFTDIYELLESPIKTRAPEVIESQRWSIKSDVWSFAIVLYQMLTYGAEPYPGMDNTELMNFILTSYEVPCPAGRNFNHSEKRLLKILQCCWIKDPFKRPDFKYLVEFFKCYFTSKDAENLMEYLPSPKQVASLKGGKGAVTGITTFKDEMFLTRDDSTNIETYCGSKLKRGRLIALTERAKSSLLSVFKSKVSEHGEKQTGLQDVTCDRIERLFTCEWNDHRIYCIGLNTRKVISSWQVKAGKPSGLSTTGNRNVLVSCTSECKICEYTFNGDLVHEISFGCNRDGPRHALQFGSHLLIVCHGKTDTCQESEGVSIIDLYGKISLGTKTTQLINPSHLAVDSKQQILIAERARNRIILANRTLDGRHRILLTSEYQLEAPTRIHLNEAKGLILVGLENGTVIVYLIKSPMSNTDDEAKSDSASPLTHENMESSNDDDYGYTAEEENPIYGDCTGGDYYSPEYEELP